MVPSPPARSHRGFGFVTAAAHEYLIHVRKGRVIQHGQGSSCLALWGDSVARVDTSVHRLQFTADQVTREKTGVQVTGLAVFRVVAPLIAWRMLDLDDPARYHGILREMFVGATRRLVANLTLEACMTRRKDALAAELMAEIAPVVGGRGMLDDGTDQGWGVSLDTIEVQDVRVLSSEVFERLQAPYREALALEALQAADEVARERDRLQAERARTSEAQRHALMALEEARLEAERRREAANVAQAQRLADQAQASELARDERALAARLETEARLAAAERDIAQARADAEQVRGEARAAVVRLERAALSEVSDARLQELALTETLPRVAEAFAGSFDHVVVTGGDLGFLGQGIGQVIGVLDAMGVKLPGRDPG